ncbi:hypothetical protein PIB30_037935 [Stylosanthes scabra]|uniref:Uncharacterized protein n=1 Tax=Stylosanthes scabra TaxID=79078 RepID=A0ABU6UFU7_9FABA|nr:hypothetical protein [Stylosanthes scabra]
MDVALEEVRVYLEKEYVIFCQLDQVVTLGGGDVDDDAQRSASAKDKEKVIVMTKIGNATPLDLIPDTNLRAMNLTIVMISSSTNVMVGGTKGGPILELDSWLKSPNVNPVEACAADEVVEEYVMHEAGVLLPRATNSEPVREEVIGIDIAHICWHVKSDCAAIGEREIISYKGISS